MKLAAAVVTLGLIAPACAQTSWTFAVSGDSRNCGDVVMPVIAAKVHADKADFYWHLGDFRALYDFDQDMLAARHGKLTISDYQAQAWQDFTEQQLAPFGDTPVVLALGNHETIGKTRPELLAQFADWFDSPIIRAQRLKDDPNNHALKTYYHWREHNVDFITMDNASAEQFDAAQVKWFEMTLKRAEDDPAIRTVVVGMHEALPDSLTTGHSMNESPTSTVTGDRVYKDLLDFRNRSGKEVQVLASHSHFVLEQPYKTACRKPEDVLSGWIIGTAGAVRYRLPVPESVTPLIKTDVYGYLLATVSPEGHITFAFHEIPEADALPTSVTRYGNDLVHACFVGNQDQRPIAGPTCDK